jgi:hypothetical protein
MTQLWGGTLRATRPGLRGSLNTYAYVGENPVSLVDVFGLVPGQPFGSIPAAAVDALNWV